MALADYHVLLTNHTIHSDLGRHLNPEICAIIIDYLCGNSFGRFSSAYFARKVIKILEFKPAAKIFLFNGDFYVVDFAQYKALKSFVSFVCSLDFTDNDIDFNFLQSYFINLCCYYRKLYECCDDETILNPAPLPDFVDLEFPF